MWPRRSQYDQTGTTLRAIFSEVTSASVQELVIYRVADGRIAECWGDLDSTVRDELTSGAAEQI